MNSQVDTVLPIPVPVRLPEKITPCRILEAVFELRFVTNEPWRTLPGLVSAKIRDHYSNQKDLPLASMPEEIRLQNPQLAHLPLMHFIGDAFIVQLGPQAVSLTTKSNAYPGWSAINNELAWLFERLESSGFIREGKRLGVRYVDFFPMDVFPNLIMGVHVNVTPLLGFKNQITTVFQRSPFTLRLSVLNDAMVSNPSGNQTGSIVDLDVWLDALEFDFSSCLSRFGEAHQISKETFFGLLKPDFLATLNPVYS